jgi:hypothetical protein
LTSHRVLFDPPQKFTERNPTNAEPFDNSNEHGTVIRGKGCGQIKCFPLQAFEPKTIAFTAAAEKVAIG